MLFVVFIIVLTLGIIGSILIDDYKHCFLNIFSTVVAVVAAGAIIISFVGITYNYITTDAFVAENKQIYNSLVYQYENEVFDDDDDMVGKKELYNQIQDWNKDLARYKSLQDDFWIGIYYPNVFDQFEFIEYKDLNGA